MDFFIANMDKAEILHSPRICTRTIAANMITQPRISLPVIRSPRSKAPAITANTDSKLMRSDATAGSVYFCAMICSV